MDKIYYKNGYEYQLEKDFSFFVGFGFSGGNDFVWLTPTGWLVCKRGYAWDGPSGPTIHTKNFLRGSLVHDALYQLIRLGVLPMEARNEIDLILKDIVLEDGMNQVRAWWVHKAVDWFGGVYMQNKQDEILTAP